MEWIILSCQVMGIIGCCGSIVLSILALASKHSLERLEDEAIDEPLTGWPRLSVVIPACNEEDVIEAAMATLLTVDYPDLDIILVNDRSTDQTGHIINRLASVDSRIRATHLTTLPQGWLGKLNALKCGTALATGQVILFCDADVHFERSALKRAVSRLERQNLDHLTVMPRLLPHGFFYNMTISAFAMLYMVGVRAWRFRHPESKAYAGVGAFAMVRRNTFEKTPGWTWLRMEIADDIGLGMLMVREAGGRSLMLTGTDSISVDWYSGLKALITGLQKNIFGAICRYSLVKAFLSVSIFICLGLYMPVALMMDPLAICQSSDWMLGLICVAFVLQGMIAVSFRQVGLGLISTLCAPLGYLIFAWILAGSTRRTLKQGGVYWRTQFYSIAELRKGSRIDL